MTAESPRRPPARGGSSRRVRREVTTTIWMPSEQLQRLTDTGGPVEEVLHPQAACDPVETGPALRIRFLHIQSVVANPRRSVRRRCRCRTPSGETPVPGLPSAAGSARLRSDRRPRRRRAHDHAETPRQAARWTPASPCCGPRVRRDRCRSTAPGYTWSLKLLGAQDLPGSRTRRRRASCSPRRHRRRPGTAAASPRPASPPPRAPRPAAADSDVMPIPTSTQASSGSAAASPHTPTGLPGCCPASAVIAISCEHGRLPGVGQVARSVAIRSAAIVYWVRSLVPIDRKSTTSSIRWASSAADGTSTITPGFRPTPARPSAKSRPRRRSRPSAPSPRSRCRSPRAAAAMPSSCRDSRPGLSNDSPQPADAERGVLLPSGCANEPPACRSRRRACGRRRQRPAKGSQHLGVDGGLLLGRRLVDAVEEAQLGAEQTHALDRSRRAARADSPSATLARILTGAVGRLARAGPGGQRGARRAGLLDRRGGLVGVGRRRSTVPACRRPAASCRPRRLEPGDPDHARDPELPGDDRGVAGRAAALGHQRQTTAPGRGSRCRPARGPRRTGSTAASGICTPGSGSPTSWATTRRSMSRRSVTRSAISPPICVNTVDELLDGRRRGASRSSPLDRCLRPRRAQRPCREPGRRWR